MDEKCTDQVTVELLLQRNGEIVFQGSFNESTQVEEFGSVDMQRNNTHLQFSVSVLMLSHHMVCSIVCKINNEQQ